MRRRGYLRVVGAVALEDVGRPLWVYCNGWTPHPRQLKHEVLLTEFLLLYEPPTVRRGYDVDRDIRPDAEMEFGGKRYLVELDTGEMTHRQLRDRWVVYQTVEEYLLIVTLSAGRMQQLRTDPGLRDLVAPIALLTTLAQAKENPFGPIWLDYYGNETALPRG